MTDMPEMTYMTEMTERTEMTDMTEMTAMTDMTLTISENTWENEPDVGLESFHLRCWIRCCHVFPNVVARELSNEFIFVFGLHYTRNTFTYPLAESIAFRFRMRHIQSHLFEI